MKSSEVRRYESRVNNLNRQIQLKENEKSEKKSLIDEHITELRSLRTQIDDNQVHRITLNNELNELGPKKENALSDMKKAEAGLLYKKTTKREYEELIKRFENELQSNCRKYSRHEEETLLKAIKEHKQGIQQLEAFEIKKAHYNRLSESFNGKRQELNENWKQFKELNGIKKVKKLALDQLKIELEEIEKEIISLKKQLEDLVRENVHRQQQAKKQMLERTKSSSSNLPKEDEYLSSMEHRLTIYNKLINYFHKLVNSEETTELSGTNLNLNASYSNTTTPTAPFKNSLFYSLDQKLFNRLASLDANSTPIKDEQDELKYDNQFMFDLDCNNNNNNNNKERLTTNMRANVPKSLALRSSYKSEDYTAKQTPISFAYTPTYPLLSSVVTPVDEQTQTGANALFLLKNKKSDDDLNAKNAVSSGRRRSLKKQIKQSKAVKISHSIEVINMLNELEIAITLSSQFEECLKVLRSGRDCLLNEIETYKSVLKQSIKDANKSKATSEEPNEKCSLENDIMQRNDAKSVISSCLDSNYESECNSISQGACKLNKIDLDVKFTAQIEDEQEQLNNLTITSTSEAKLILKQDENSKQTESELSLYDNILFNKRKNSKSSRSTSSSNSNSDSKTVTPASPKTPSVLTEDVQAIKRVETEQAIKVHNFSRQFSDGYSSSCTPLSASSINSEQANLNPFFKNTN